MGTVIEFPTTARSAGKRHDAAPDLPDPGALRGPAVRRARDIAVLDRLRTWSECLGGWPTQIEQLRTAIAVDDSMLATLRSVVDEGHTERVVVAGWIAVFAERCASERVHGLAPSDRLGLEQLTTHLIKRRLRELKV